METQIWLDEGNFSQSKVEVIERNIHIFVNYSSNFIVAAYKVATLLYAREPAESAVKTTFRANNSNAIIKKTSKNINFS